ncbi:O-antigen translocase [Massilia sp. DWR3-1-1]|uniref:O-antigen translocase n=1 Tax=Massilia sp. DWR3-1-1 TaxID=2804559 RepID=UPI003CF5240E
MSLIKTSLLNGIAVIVRMATGIILNKVLAVYVGPGGYAAIGQLQNVSAMVTSFASGAINTGVTKFTAEHFDDTERRNSLWRTAGTITVIGSMLASVLLLVFSAPLGNLLFPGALYEESLKWLAACLVLITLNAYILSILSGLKEVRRYVKANIASSIFGLVISGGLALQMGLRGALIALSLGQAFAFLTTVYFCRGLDWFKPKLLFGKVDAAVARNLAKFVAMALTSAAAVPLTQMLIRSHLVISYSPANAGLWDALNKISGIYLALITTTLSLYYLPRISEIRDAEVLRAEIWSGFRLIFPVTSILAISLFFLRDPLVRLLFSPEFQGVTKLMGWQLVGDVIKVVSWLLGYVLIGRGMMLPYIVTEILFSITLYGLTIYATQLFGFPGVSVAYAVNYTIYLIAMYWLVLVRQKNRFV